LPQQARLGELMQGVVDGRQGNLDPRPADLVMQALGGDVTVLILEKQTRQFHPLAGGAQTGLPQPANRQGGQGLAVARGFAHGPKSTSQSEPIRCQGRTNPAKLVTDYMLERF